MKPLQHALAALALALLLGAPAGAEDGKGRIRGKVIDEYNAITLPGAPVEVVETGALVYTDMDGVYEVSLPAGSYDLKVAFSGYKDALYQGVTVAAGQTTTLDVVLETPTVALTEEITVTAEAGPAATTQAAALDQSSSA